MAASDESMDKKLATQLELLGLEVEQMEERLDNSVGKLEQGINRAQDELFKFHPSLESIEEGSDEDAEMYDSLDEEDLYSTISSGQEREEAEAKIQAAIDLSKNEIRLLNHVIEATPIIRDSLQDAIVIDLPNEYQPKPKRSFKDKIHSTMFDVLAPEYREFWELYTLLLVCWVSVVTPYTVSFGIPMYPSTFLGAMEIVVSISYAVDIILNFRTAFYDPSGELVWDRREITRKYLKGWFILDLLCVFPFAFLMHGRTKESSTSLVKLFKVIKGVKTITFLKTINIKRPLRFSEFIITMESIFGMTAVHFVKFLIHLFAVSHWSACLFHYAAKLDGEESASWLATDAMKNAGDLNRYFTAVYWSLITMSTVGYGDVLPVGRIERIVAMFCMLVFCPTFCYLMGWMAASLRIMDGVETKSEARRQMIDEYMISRLYPRGLAKRVRSFFKRIVGKEVAAEEADVIAMLSTTLRTQTVLRMFRKVLAKVSFFHDKYPLFNADTMLMLKPLLFNAGDFVVYQKGSSTEMYFVQRGSLEVRLYKDRPDIVQVLESDERDSLPYHLIRTIEAGSHFGDYSCLTVTPRTATVVAVTDCEVYALPRENLMELLEKWPRYRNGLESNVDPCERSHRDAKSNERENKLAKMWAKQSTALVRPLKAPSRKPQIFPLEEDLF